jgi:small subunit ribosomal protein S17
MPKRVAIGVVTSDKMTKTRRVEIPRLIRHPMYGKFVRRKTICYVHDETEQSRVGDRVEIEECRPMSRHKRWNLVQVIEKSRAVDVVALRAKRAAGKTVEAAPTETRPVEPEAAETKPDETESAEAGPDETKPAETETAEQDQGTSHSGG